MVTLFILTIPTPLLAAISTVALFATVLLWLMWPRYWRWKRERISPALAWEIVDGAPRNRQDLYISDQALALIGPDYSYIGRMPANFICVHCGSPENIDIRLYHHIPSHTMILLSRHNCLKLPQGGTTHASAFQDSGPLFRSSGTAPRGGSHAPRGSGIVAASRYPAATGSRWMAAFQWPRSPTH